MKKRFLSGIFSLVLTSLLILLFEGCKKDEKNNKPPSVVDVDGNVYNIVTIGTQVWMAENLKVTKFRNGDTIPKVTNTTSWSQLKTGAFCYYANDVINADTYGGLYNWYAVNDTRNIAPAGWHIPSDGEWQILIDYLGGDNLAGGKLKETGNSHWIGPNTGATNVSGFTGLPGGLRDQTGNFSNIGKGGTFWSSTEEPGYWAWYRTLVFDKTLVVRGTLNKEYGFSVRCIKD